MKIRNCKRSKVKNLFGVLLSCCFFSSQAFAFNSDTHRFVTETSFNLASELNDKKIFSDSEFTKYRDIICEYSLKPDEDEIEGAYKYHFYNPATESNFMGEKTSALTKCVTHYDSAVDYYKKGNKVMAFQELGRASHFLEDLNTPVHTGYDLPTDAVIRFPLHVRFEKVCDKIIGKCQISVPKEGLRYFEDNSVESIAKSSSVLSGGNYYYLTELKDTKEESIAKNAVHNAQNKVTGLIYKFFAWIKNL